MDPLNDREAELRRREQEIEARERTIRLQELEAELYRNQQEVNRSLGSQEPPMYRTVKHDPPDSRLQRWSRKAIMVAQFAGVFVLTVAAFRLATWLAYITIVSAVAFVAYKVIFKNNQPRR